MIMFNKFIVIMCMLVGYCHSEPLAEFKDFVEKFDKNYSQHEYFHRMQVFYENLDFINKHNMLAYNGTYNYYLGVGPFTDLTLNEFSKNYLMKEDVGLTRCQVQMQADDSIPTALDWREKNTVTPIKNQGNCGSCWSFSTTGAIESLMAIETGNLESLSEQELVDCSTKYGNQGCNGGLMTQAFKYVIDQGGLCSESDYSYTASDDKCKECTVVEGSNIKNCFTIPKGNYKVLLSQLSKQPISVGIQADTPQFQHYKSGIFDESSCYTGEIDHGVLLVAYDADSMTIKNSWGEEWGDQGYIRIARTEDNVGICGVYLSASYPTY